MEAVLMPYSRNQNQGISPYYTQMRNRNNPMNGAFISENFAPPSSMYGGHFLGPINMNHQTQIQMNPRQPPLLPLPISRSYSSAGPRSRGNKIKKPKQQQQQAVRRRQEEASNQKDVPLDIFTLSPPPSSLPLPRFCLRPKAEAGGPPPTISGRC